MKKERVDVLLVKRGLADSRSQAQRLVMAGQVRADGQVVPKPSTTLAAGVPLEVDAGPRFVSRGGEKLEAALLAFRLNVSGKVCADVGASTGGFTDCLLKNGASKVYAIDVGHGVLHWKLRQNPRVVVMENTNARYLDSLPEDIDIATVDASFISLKILLPVMIRWFSPSPAQIAGLESPDSDAGGNVVVLIKPQFEAGRREASRGEGVIRDPEIHRRVLNEVLQFAKELGFGVRNLIRSPVLGAKGNVEFLAHLIYPCADSLEPDKIIDQLSSKD
jgi:23S rRNA (cytidine1920-2'-O)/16S rRNA (cytidine1409-2'-O)-methyltransferase